jgi:hypothetical protein
MRFLVSTSRWSAALAAAGLSLAVAGVAPAQDAPRNAPLDPFFADGKLYAAPETGFRGLAGVEKPGRPVFDPSTGQWFASANGQLVRLEEDGGLTVVADDVQGTDLDVRAAAGLAVSREPDKGIVLHRLAGGAAGQDAPTLRPSSGQAAHSSLCPSCAPPPRGEANGAPSALAEADGGECGDSFFHPRFSPSGDMLLVAGSTVEGGEFRVLPVSPSQSMPCSCDLRPSAFARGFGGTSSSIRLCTTLPRDFADHPPLHDASAGLHRPSTDSSSVRGVAPAWLPDGRGVIFSRIVHDTLRVTAAELWVVDLATGRETQLTDTPGIAEIEPAVSEDAATLAYVDALTGELRQVSMPALPLPAPTGQEVRP